ncbi:GSCFA domain-containing protein [Flavobacterium sp. SM15]|uniref:GSCFA domain-containing protein n=1 Tax=Flavobacterium sp. SM15 TaxID=2908005 RepID=UPI001EDC36CB|nr:GSCFA domain-containing protein [Flavobacterium sp. SM15]MCG2610634.1 GSCFA domain-containing protein [Flavobacterium sp. SM15]
MNFLTKIPLVKTESPIDYNSRILLLGSCFAENIGSKFDYYKFQSLVNPFGIIFNPVSIADIVRRATDKDFFSENDAFFYNERWNSYQVHSELSSANKETFLEQLNYQIEVTQAQILQASHVCVTLGTAWVYRHLENNMVVANCHKVPQKHFQKELLSVEEILKSLEEIVSKIRSLNKEVKFIFTVSPVRHIKDGFVENQLSKAHLLTALHKYLGFKNSGSSYFPSYEIMMDELRDYRFYAQDMLHPNSIAIDYIWQRFTETFITQESFSIMEEVEVVQKSLLHKPFNPTSESHNKFLENLNKKMESVQQKVPHIEF